MRSLACLNRRAQKSGGEVLRDLGGEFSTHAPEGLPDDEGHRGWQEKVRAEGVGGGGRMAWGLILRGLVVGLVLQPGTAITRQPQEFQERRAEH